MGHHHHYQQNVNVDQKLNIIELHLLAISVSFMILSTLTSLFIVALVVLTVLHLSSVDIQLCLWDFPHRFSISDKSSSLMPGIEKEKLAIKSDIHSVF